MAGLEDREERLDAALRAGRMIALSALLGMGIFYALVVFLLQSQPSFGAPPPPTAATLPLPAAGLALSLLTLFLSFLIRTSALRQARAAARGIREPLGLLLARYRSATLMAIGFCDAGGFLHAVLTLVAGPAYLGWLAAGLISAVGIVWHLPSRTALDQLLADVERDRQDPITPASLDSPSGPPAF
jgi:hypothetical protein